MNFLVMPRRFNINLLPRCDKYTDATNTGLDCGQDEDCRFIPS